MSTAKNLGADTVWLVTGCSTGLGASLARQILSAGHKLIATARSVSALSSLPAGPGLLTVALDVTSPEAIKAAFAAGIKKFGHIDVVINNAGYGMMGDTESATEEDRRQVFETNFWGVTNVSLEAVRVMRDVNEKGRGGLIVQVSSFGGFVAYPGGAYYHASKFALEGWTGSMARELSPSWNISFLTLQPGGISSNFLTTSLKAITPHPAYTDPACGTRQLEAFIFANPDFAKQMSMPDRVAKVVFDTIVNKGERPLPEKLPLGTDSFWQIHGKLDSLKKDIEDWKEVTESTMDEETRAAAAAWVKGG